MVEDKSYQTIAELRRRNVRAYIDEHCDGSPSRFAEAVGRSRQQIQKLLSDPGKTTSARMLGSQLARRLESQLNLTAGFFDQDHDALSASGLMRDIKRLSERDRSTVETLIHSMLGDQPGNR